MFEPGKGQIAEATENLRIWVKHVYVPIGTIFHGTMKLLEAMGV